MFVGILVVGWLFISGGGQLFSVGFSGLALSKADFVSNDPNVGGEAWVLLVSLSGTGQSLQGTITKDQVVDTTDNVKATSDFTLKTEIIDNKVEYTIQNDFDQFYYVEYSYSHIYDVDAFIRNCQSQPGFLAAHTRSRLGIPPAEGVCFLKQPSGTKGIVRDDFKRIFNAAISTILSGVETKTTINTIESTSAAIGNVGFVKWEGFLASDVNEPTPAGQDVCALYNFGWKLIDCSDFQSWKSDASAASVAQCIQSAGDLNTVATQCRQTVNNAASLVNQGKEFTALGGQGEKYIGYTSGTESAGKVTLNLPRLYAIPLMTVTLKTSYIGKIQINVPVGRPDIIAVRSEKFQSGATTKGFIYADVKNIGNGDGAFDVSASCPAPFSSDDRIRLNVVPSATQTAVLTLTASTTQPINGVCTVKALDVNNPANFDTAQVVVEATNIQICNPGTKKVEGRSILQCNQFGSGYDVIETCPEGKVADPTTFTCIDEVPTDTGGNIFDDINDFLNRLGIFVIIVLISVVAILYFRRR